MNINIHFSGQNSLQLSFMRTKKKKDEHKIPILHSVQAVTLDSARYSNLYGLRFLYEANKNGTRGYLRLCGATGLLELTLYFI